MTCETCAACGSSTMSVVTVPFVVKHGDKQEMIQDERMRCSACDNLSYVGKQISKHELAVAAAIRRIDGLLSAEELCRIRLKYKFKQTEMEQMLSTGSKTWTRWERGKIPQNKAADKLIRMIAEEPEVARRLMVQAGVVNAEASAIFEQIDRDASTIAREKMKIELGNLTMSGADFVERFYDVVLQNIEQARKQANLNAEAA